MTLTVSNLRKGGPRLPTRIPRVRSDLTPRERQIIAFLGTAPSAPEIGRRLGISPHTVRNHLKSIYEKCDVHNRTEMLLYAMRQRWLAPDGRPTTAATP
jgi:DNA-binding CsgD family transcriptional regulator